MVELVGEVFVINGAYTVYFLDFFSLKTCWYPKLTYLGLRFQRKKYFMYAQGQKSQQELFFKNFVVNFSGSTLWKVLLFVLPKLINSSSSDNGCCAVLIILIATTPRPIQSLSRNVCEESAVAKMSYHIVRFFVSLITPIYKGPRSKWTDRKSFLT